MFFKCELACFVFYFIFFSVLLCIFYIISYSRRELEVVKCTWAGNTRLEAVVVPSCGCWCHSAPSASHGDRGWQRGLAERSSPGLICSMSCYLCHVTELIKYKPWSPGSSWSPFQSHHCVRSFKFSLPKPWSLWTAFFGGVFSIAFFWQLRLVQVSCHAATGYTLWRERSQRQIIIFEFLCSFFVVIIEEISSGEGFYRGFS